MNSLTLKIALLACSFVTLISCAGEPSIQKYIVEKQNHKSFVSMDVPKSLLLNNKIELTTEQQNALNSISKINITALPKGRIDDKNFELEMERVHAVLKNERYEPLLNYGGSESQINLYFVGNIESIDEFIIFASAEDRGFGVFRILGKDMNPAQFITLLGSIDNTNLGFPDLQEFKELF